MIERNPGELRVFLDAREVAAAVADAFVDDARTAISQRGAFFVALAGGTTPKAAYQLLAQEPRVGAVDWQRVHVYFGDERCVPPDSDDSNYKMAREAFLSRVPVPEQNVHRMHGEADPLTAARDYAQLLVQTVGEVPQFDFIMLGMGADGHTASLFPGTDPLVDNERLVRAVYVEKLKANRITLTPLVINNARHVLISTEGLAKAPALYAVRMGPYEPVEHPIQIVAPVRGTLSWYVDQAAAAELSAK
jgi:6-phosphogluconolactonase